MNPIEQVAPDRVGRRRQRNRGVVVMVALLGCFAMVWQASHAAFSDTTTNTGNTLGAGTVVISDNAAGAMFTAPALAPGATGTACIGVEYLGSLTNPAVKLYFTGAQESNSGGAYGAWANDATSEADDNLSMQIEVWNTDLGSNPGYNNCTPGGAGSFVDLAGVAPGTNLKSLINANTDYATGLLSQWGTVTANMWRVFRFTYTFSASALDSAQGDGVKFNIVWEAQR
ncbi:hypothetical protein [Actinoplanes solisilvae]|uniref:hypothetical protein n=1 Tax=Actinoplanes solisilvae TaxID=2486853 RepID=UPI000FD6FBDA|nr:hypothetical protein [Actinoplanes solisilvae]